MTSTVAITGLVTSPIARMVASRGDRWNSAMLRSTFSTTTMASSTTMPMANMRPKSVSRLIENPSEIIPAKVPTRATKIATVQMTVARRFCRKRKTTSTTSRTASKSVCFTSSIEIRTKSVVSREIV